MFNRDPNECGRFSTQIKPKDGAVQETTCLKYPPPDDGQMRTDVVNGYKSDTTDRRLDEQEVSSRDLNPNGYK